MKKYLFALLLFSYSCTTKRDPTPVVTAIKETGKLVTAEYTLTKIIKANDNKTWYKVGDRKILMSCEAYVKAGIDLRQITKENVVQSDSSVSITLPRAAIFSLNIPAEKIQLQYEEVGLLRDPFTAGDREALLVQAQKQIEQLVDSLGILKTAEENAVVFLQKMLQGTTSKKINISVTK